ncbi:hypothetical protein, partial [Streptosporangium vulgare]|uniref:hypothetical protein n=1 Tax=Streptosporangium vulgare TaxID=46190 RepID=UPI0031E27D77
MSSWTAATPGSFSSEAALLAGTRSGDAAVDGPQLLARLGAWNVPGQLGEEGVLDVLDVLLVFLRVAALDVKSLSGLRRTRRGKSFEATLIGGEGVVVELDHHVDRGARGRLQQPLVTPGEFAGG